MSALPKQVSNPNPASAVSATFLKYLPAVQTHAGIQLRGLPATDREEAVAEATAAAFLNVHSAIRNGKAHRLKPSMVAHFAALHVHDGRHVGGRTDTTTDVLSSKAQRLRGFKVHGLPWDSVNAFDVLKISDQTVWKDRLLHDRRTLPPDQTAFRIDFSQFMAGQADRTRTLLAMLGSGYRSVEVADHLGITASAICQRRTKAAREWSVYQGEEPDMESKEESVTAPQTA